MIVTEKIAPVNKSEDKRKLIIVIPSFNDWEALEKLLQLIDEIILSSALVLEILVVDDFSDQPISNSLIHHVYRQIQAVNILRLRRNLGHQRAITVGLCYVYDYLQTNFVVVMDGDGEDNPFEIERLLNVSEQNGNDKIIFAKRTKRAESPSFKFLYFIYKKLYQMLIGREMSVGNFSLIPATLLKNVVIISEIWNHYSSGIYRSRIPYLEIPVPRTKRIAGQPKMNLVSLVTHGLSSIAVYGDIVGTRILLATVFLLLVVCVLLGIVLTIRIFTNWGISGSGWATYTSGLLTLSLFQLMLLGTVFSMIILSARNSFNVIPVRDYKYYVDSFFQL
ncbi:MAG: glycosyltransferase [Microcystis aeruginosa Ma_QC_C_20070823_S13]|jgi:glycosyltransferase involved in cell wall biosynthesis|nr:glycosyltransferase [Microcystis aeruginosa BS11-05]TRU61957.1 MAG: glycosyltransferase [Microcystis aeruginosa Ma_QC_C_20070823_S13D]TRU64207.1 MAG: glycosyltransferase [Microcystis aeruginosa Ma_QC_C_20070823_S13]